MVLNSLMNSDLTAPAYERMSEAMSRRKLRQAEVLTEGFTPGAPWFFGLRRLEVWDVLKAVWVYRCLTNAVVVLQHTVFLMHKIEIRNLCVHHDVRWV